MDAVFQSSENFCSHVLMCPMNNVVLIGELLLLDNITIEKLSNLRMTAMRAGKESKSSSSSSFCLVAELARPFPHPADVIKATFWPPHPASTQPLQLNSFSPNM